MEAENSEEVEREVREKHVIDRTTKGFGAEKAEARLENEMKRSAMEQ